MMRLWIGSETTFDVEGASLAAFGEFCDRFNASSRLLEVDTKLRNLDIVVIIMNPAIAPPFPEGVISRGHMGELDCKFAVPFSRWIAASTDVRREITHGVVVKAIAEIPKSMIDEESRTTLREIADATLRRGK